MTATEKQTGSRDQPLAYPRTLRFATTHDAIMILPKRQARPQWGREKRRLAWDKARGAFMRDIIPGLASSVFISSVVVMNDQGEDYGQGH